MYQVQGFRAFIDARSGGAIGRPVWARVSPVVLLLGLTSLFTDISAEMVNTVLPLYLVVYLQMSPLAFGVVDGIYQGGAALARLAAGVVADRLGRPKEVAATGYALSAVSKVGLFLAPPVWGPIAASVGVDRVGKGIRTAPRDAMIAASTLEPELGTAFGVHRALDTAGAMIGPLLAFVLLAIVPNGYSSVFAISICVALVGLGIIVLFVHHRAADRLAGGHAAPASLLLASFGLLRVPRFRALVLAAGALGLVTLSDAFLYLTLQRRTGITPSLVPLLYVATAMVYMVLAVPVGQLADRVGRARVFVVGYGLLLAVYVGLMLPLAGAVPAAVVAAPVVVLLGVYYASTDSVEAAFASSVLPAELRATGLALFGTVANLAGLLSSVLFGWLWTRSDADGAIAVFAAGLLVAIVAAAAVLALARPTMVDVGELDD